MGTAPFVTGIELLLMVGSLAFSLSLSLCGFLFTYLFIYSLVVRFHFGYLMWVYGCVDVVDERNEDFRILKERRHHPSNLYKYYQSCFLCCLWKHYYMNPDKLLICKFYSLTSLLPLLSLSRG